MPAEPAEQVGTSRGEVAVALEPLDPVEEREPRLDVSRERDRDGAVEADDGEGSNCSSTAYVAAIAPGVGAFGVTGRDRRPGAGTARADAATRRAGGRAGPRRSRRRSQSASVLVGEEDELSVGADARVAPRVLQQQQREQPEGLRLVRHQDAEELREADRLGAEIAADERVAGRGGVALVEDEVEHPEHVGHAVGEEVVGRHAERDARLAEPPLRADEPLRERRLRDEERARDLRRREPGDLAQRQRDARVDRERGMAAREQEREALVGDRAHVGVLVVGHVLETGEELRLACERLLATDPVDCAVPGGRDDPGARASEGRRRAATARARSRRRPAPRPRRARGHRGRG